MNNTTKADAVLLAALDGALNKGFRNRGVYVDSNIVDAFTARLIDAGVDMDAIDDLLAEGNPDLIDAGE